jgi:uncharacterized protein YndB with AHSA1/START domain
MTRFYKTLYLYPDMMVSKKEGVFSMKLSYTFYIQSSAEDIWSILTTPEGTEKIFYGAKVVSTFKVGDAIAYVGPGRDGDATRHIEGKILEVIPMQLLAHTYCVGESYR